LSQTLTTNAGVVQQWHFFGSRQSKFVSCQSALFDC